jgi:Ca2+-binding EF-hand superfamily protein
MACDRAGAYDPGRRVWAIFMGIIMSTKKILFGAGAALFVLSGTALAQQPAPGGERPASVTRDQAVAKAEERFAALDGNRDGRVTVDEAQQARQARRAERQGQMFDRLDANRDGQISREEFGQRLAMRAERRGERGMRRGMRGMGAERRAMRMFGEDGAITREEFRQRALQRFERLDANRDGTVTVEERRAAREQMRGERRARRMQRD